MSRSLGSIFDGGLTAGKPTRAELLAGQAVMPAVSAADVAFLVANADVIRDDYARAFGEVYDATTAGKHAAARRYAIGGAAGLALGLAAWKLIG